LFCRTDALVIAGTQFRIGCRPIGACTPLQTSVHHAALAKQLPNQTGWREPAEAAAMSKSDYDQLSRRREATLYQCQPCGKRADMRQLDDVLFHEDHKPRPDIQYDGAKRIG